MAYSTRIISPEVDADKEALRTGYQQALTDLQTIQSATFANNAQRDAAIKKEAQILEQLIRIVKKALT